MSDPITIPPEVLEAAARAIRTFYSDQPTAVCDGVSYKAAHAACLAMLENWPGMQREAYANGEEGIFLPLTENTNDKG